MSKLRIDIETKRVIEKEWRNLERCQSSNYCKSFARYLCDPDWSQAGESIDKLVK